MKNDEHNMYNVEILNSYRLVTALVAREPRAPQHVEQTLPRALNLLALVVHLQVPRLSRRRRADRR